MDYGDLKIYLHPEWLLRTPMPNVSSVLYLFCTGKLFVDSEFASQRSTRMAREDLKSSSFEVKRKFNASGRGLLYLTPL